MSIKRTFNGATVSKPGAYSAVKVQNLTGYPLQPTGTVGLIGEAVGGEPRVLDILEGPQIQAAKERYKSGTIADGLGLVAEPSKDPRVPNGASKVVIYKPNNSTRSAYSLASTISGDLVDLLSENWGADENNLNVVVSEGQTEGADAKLLGTIDGPFTVANGQTLIIDIFGTTYTFTNTLVGSQTAAAMQAELDTVGRWAPSKPTIASVNGNKVDLTIDTGAISGSKEDYGYLSVDATSTIDTILGITGTVRGLKGSRFLTFVKGSEEEDALQELGGPDVMSIKYVGAATSCKLKIEDSGGDRKLTTDCLGVAADNLDITLGETLDGELRPKITVKELVDVINGNAKYEASTTYSNPDVNAIDLDYYTDFQIEAVAGILKRDIQDLVNFLNTQSDLVVAERKSNVIGTVALVASPAFFTGGTDGTSTNSDWGDGFDAFRLERINTVVPLISADKGSLSVDSINALCTSHVIAMTSTAGRSERNAYCSKLGTKDEYKAAALSISSGLVSLTGQDIQVYSYSNAQLQYMDPWAYACVCAGMQAGSPVGEPITHKLLNINGLRVRDGSWDPKIDYAEMIDAGCTFAEPLDQGGYRTVVGNTTYGKDASFVWNRSSVIEAGYYVAYDLRFNLEAEYTGTKARTATATNIAGSVRTRMEVYLNAEIIVGDDLNAGKGYKNLRVTFSSGTAAINVVVTPVQGIDFILPTIYLADIQQSA